MLYLAFIVVRYYIRHKYSLVSRLLNSLLLVFLLLFCSSFIIVFCTIESF